MNTTKKQWPHNMTTIPQSSMTFTTPSTTMTPVACIVWLNTRSHPKSKSQCIEWWTTCRIKTTINMTTITQLHSYNCKCEHHHKYKHKQQLTRQQFANHLQTIQNHSNKTNRAYLKNRMKKNLKHSAEQCCNSNCLACTKLNIVNYWTNWPTHKTLQQRIITCTNGS